MSKHRETASERLWKEKLGPDVSMSEAIVLIAFSLAAFIVWLAWGAI